MSLYNVYILKVSVIQDDDPTAWRTVYWQRRVRASSRVEALEKCVPDIVKKVVPHVHPSRKLLAVYVGRKGSVTGAANRLDPITINFEGQRVVNGKVVK